MLPFLRKAKSPGVIVEQRQSDNPSEISEMEACAKDLLDALEAKDIKGIAAALQAAHTLCESAPMEQDSE